MINLKNKVVRATILFFSKIFLDFINVMNYNNVDFLRGDYSGFRVYEKI